MEPHPGSPGGGTGAGGGGCPESQTEDGWGLEVPPSSVLLWLRSVHSPDLSLSVCAMGH